MVQIGDLIVLFVFVDQVLEEQGGFRYGSDG